MMRTLQQALVAWIVMLGWLGWAGADTPPADEGVVAWIAEQAVTQEQLLTYAQSNPLFYSSLATPSGAQQILNNYLVEQLLLRAGEQLYQIPRHQDEDDIPYIYRVLDRLVERCEPPSEEDLQDFYAQYAQRFATPLYLRVRRIGRHYADEASRDSVLEQLHTLKQEITSGQTAFADAVSAFSEDTETLHRSGDMGFIAGEIGGANDPVFDQLAELSTGQLYGPVVGAQRAYLYQVTDRREPLVPSYTEIRDELPQHWLADCRRQRLHAVVRPLLEHWPVRIADDWLLPDSVFATDP